MEAGPNDLVLREGIEEDSYSVELSEIEDHCTLQSENSVQIGIVAEETAEAEFGVNCKGIFRKKIVFFRNQSESTKAMNSMAQQSYFAMNYDGSDIEKVNEFSLDGRINFSSEVSPDGTKIVFQRSLKNYKYQGLFTINNDGTGEKMIHNSEMELTNPWISS